MMACKARMFPDNDDILTEIMTTTNPTTIKALGRSVRNYDDAVWAQHRYNQVLRGIKAKFSQNPAMAKILLNTGDAIIAEASPTDRIWGVGLRATDSRILNPSKWQGQNLLGRALMETRTELKADTHV
jgi:ribA/ribD-fused uncharacterized protein